MVYDKCNSVLSGFLNCRLGALLNQWEKYWEQEFSEVENQIVHHFLMTKL